MANHFDRLELNEWYETVNNPTHKVNPDIENDVWFVKFSRADITGKVKADFITSKHIKENEILKADDFPFFTKSEHIEHNYEKLEQDKTRDTYDYIHGWNIRNDKLKIFIMPHLLVKLTVSPTVRYEEMKLLF
tara:strand:- start:260 stop:658 length:399 start_codon:yes stop_codon:yes gene_type:complete